MARQVEHLVREAPLVVVPRHELDEVIVEREAGLGIKDAGVRIGDEVGGDDLVIDILDDAGHRTFRGSLDGSADLIIRRSLLKAAGQIDDGHVRARDAHGGAGQLALQGRDDLADCLGSAGAGRDDVAVHTAGQTPVLLGEAVDDLLGGRVGMDGGHKALDDAEIIVDDLGQRRQAVRGARSVGHDLDIRGVRIEVNAADEHRRVVLGRAGEHDDLRAGVQMILRLFLGQERAGALEHILDTQLAPGQELRVAVVEQRNALAIDDQSRVLIANGKIVTTEAKAKEIRKVAEGLIAAAVREKDNFDEVTVTAKVARKDADGKRVKEVVDGKKVTVYDEVEKKIKKDQPSRLHARREMLKVLYTVKTNDGTKKGAKEVDLVAKLFDEIAPKYADRNGGYTRIVKIGQRKGDGALEVLLELV